MKSFVGLLVAAVSVAAGGGGGYGDHYSTWVETSAQYEYSTLVWNKPCTTTSIWSKPAEVSYYTTTSVSYIDHTQPVTAYVPCTTTLPPEVYTSTSVYTSPTTEVVTSTSYIYSTYTSLVTVTDTVTQNNTVYSATTEIQTSSVTLPAEIIPTTIPTTIEETTVQLSVHETTITQPTTVEIPVTITAPPLPPVTVTVKPPTPVCPLNGGVPTANPLGCQGRNCSIEFQEQYAIHWSLYPDSPPLQTAITFINEQASATCITTKCNTAAFDSFYRTSLTTCAYPPCATNTIDCNCNIVVGPINLSDGGTTSVTQYGPSGWNVDLGAAPTGRNIGFCGADGGSCITSTASTLSTNLIYTDDVTSTVFGATSTAYLLPGLTSYFPLDSPFAACTTAILGPAAPRLQKRQYTGAVKNAPLKGAPDPFSTTIYADQQSAVMSSSAPSSNPAIQTTPTQTPPTTTPTSQPTETPTPSTSSPAPPPESTPSSQTPTVPTSTMPTSSTGSPATEPGTSPGSSSSYSIGSSTATVSSYSSISGTVYITETVYYSMILSPEQQSFLDSYAAITHGVATATNPGEYASSVLGLDSTGASGSSTATSTPLQQSTNVATTHKEPGYLLTLVLMFVGFL